MVFGTLKLTERQLANLRAFLVHSTLGWKEVKPGTFTATNEMDEMLEKIYKLEEDMEA